jgi:hypothetical protein
VFHARKAELFTRLADPSTPPAPSSAPREAPGVAAQERHTVAADQETQANWS